jgi:catechol 2,3-dioxygenase-like lactoylglutathione lyase family enzyme
MPEKIVGGLPGMAGVEHIGFTVPDMTQALGFFVDVIGCVEVYHLDPLRSDGSWMRDQLNVDQSAVARDIRLLRCGHGPNFELFEWETDGQGKVPPRNSDVGGHHLAFYVGDMTRAIAYLSEANVRILGEPMVRTSGPSAGQTWVYFLAPWGMQLELVSYPGGKAYEQASALKLWHPEHPAD